MKTYESKVRIYDLTSTSRVRCFEVKAKNIDDAKVKVMEIADTFGEGYIEELKEKI
jgi:hypothetical protein